MRSAVLLVVVFGITGAAGVARAEPPACFPERTLYRTTTLRDDSGAVVGGIRVGQQVRVVDDFVGDKGAWADIELDAPVPLRVRVERAALVVFARHDLEVEPGFSWWAGGYAVTILRRADDAGVVVTAASAYPGLEGSAPAGCAELSPVPVTAMALPEFEFELRPVAVSRPAGVPELAVAADTVIKDDHRHRFLVGHDQVFVLRRKGGRALVEYVDDDAGIRVRGWVPARSVRKTGRVTGGVIAGACVGDGLELTGEVEKLATEAPLLLHPRGALVATLPAGTEVRVQEASGDYVRVYVQVQAGKQVVVALDGWVHESVLLAAGGPKPADE
jgi:hypothetical protein